MARPSKGERIAVTLRLPVELADRINGRAPPGKRHDWLIAAVEWCLEHTEPFPDAGV